MRIILFFSFLLSFHIVFAQECYPEKNKDKKAVKKIEKLIKKRAYYDALDAIDALRNTNEEAVFYVLKSEILWRRGDFFNAETEALKAIDICPRNFPKANYFLGEICIFADLFDPNFWPIVLRRKVKALEKKG